MSVAALAVALNVSPAAQDVAALISRAAQPVPIEFAVGAASTGYASDQLARAGLLAAIPARIAVLAIGSTQALQTRAEAERQLAGMGPGVIADLLAAEQNLPLGLFIPPPDVPDATRITGEIRGINVNRILLAMGPPALQELSTLSTGSGAAARRAQNLQSSLGQVEIVVGSNGNVRLDGEQMPVSQLADALADRPLARTARVVAPGSLPVNEVVPVFNIIRRAGLQLDMAATSAQAVTISEDEAGDTP